MSQLTALQSAVANVIASISSLTAQVATLTLENAALKTQAETDAKTIEDLTAQLVAAVPAPVAPAAQ